MWVLVLGVIFGHANPLTRLLRKRSYFNDMAIAKKNFSKAGWFFVLQLAFIWLSTAGLFAKFSSQQVPFSGVWLIYYFFSLGVLISYSFLWQIIIGRIDLSIAYANRGILVLWSLVWSVVLFGEKLTVNNLIGASIIIIGIATFGFRD